MANSYDNEIIKENIEAPDFQEIKENAPIAEATVTPEYQPVTESAPDEQKSDDSRINQKKKNNVLSSMTGGMVAAIAAAAVGITSMLNVALDASFEYVDFSDGQIRYEVNVSDLTESDVLTAYLYDGNTLIDSQVITDDDGDGKIVGEFSLDASAIEEKLAGEDNASVSYRLTLKGMVGLNVERSFDSYLLKVDKVTSKFESVSGECHCSIDGCYHFTMDFTDDLGMFSDFKAVITDDFGNSAECTFTDNLHEEQKIFIANIKGNNPTFTLTYLANGELVTFVTKIKI